MQVTSLRELIFVFIFSVNICTKKFVVKCFFNGNDDDDDVEELEIILRTLPVPQTPSKT